MGDLEASWALGLPLEENLTADFLSLESAGGQSQQVGTVLRGFPVGYPQVGGASGRLDGDLPDSDSEATEILLQEFTCECSGAGCSFLSMGISDGVCVLSIISDISPV